MKHLRISAMAAVLSLALTVPALAAGLFSDVPAGTALYESVMYLADRGITAGTGEGRFSPAQPMTVNQWAVMLCRAYGGSDWREESRSGVAAAYQKGWVRESAVLYPDTRLCRGALYEYGFAAAGIPVYDASPYPGGQALSPYENLMRIGKQLGLWPEGADPYGIVDRGEACCFLYALLTRSFTVEAPPAPVKLENPAGATPTITFWNCTGYRHLYWMHSMPPAGNVPLILTILPPWENASAPPAPGLPATKSGLFTWPERVRCFTNSATFWKEY